MWTKNKKQFGQNLIFVPRSITEKLTVDINDKIDIEIKKSPSEKIKLNNKEKVVEIVQDTSVLIGMYIE